MLTKTKLIALTTVFAALATTACAPDPIVSEWEYEENNEQYRDRLTIEDDGNGKRRAGAEIAAYGQLYLVDMTWDIDWTEKSNERYELDFDCKSAEAFVDGQPIGHDCTTISDLFGDPDFEMDCRLKRDGDELHCEAGLTEVVYERSD